MRKPQLAQMVADYFTQHKDEVVDVRRLFRTLGVNNHPAKLLSMGVLGELGERDYVVVTEARRS